jgi:hypothetical protein
MEPIPEEVRHVDVEPSGGPSRVLMVLGVLVALMLALAGAAVLYRSIEPQNRASDTRSISVAQLQPGESESAEDASARAAADRVLAESLTRQANQTQAALSAVEGTAGVAPTNPAAPPVPSPATTADPLPPAATQVAALPPAAIVETPPVDATPTATVAAPAAAALPRPASVETPKAPEPEKVVAPPVVLDPPAAAPLVSVKPEEAARLLTRATVMIQQGDIASARLLLDRLIRAGDGRAIYLLAETFDPKMLTQWNVRGIKPDTGRAKALYGDAIKAGIGEARDRLLALGN